MPKRVLVFPCGSEIGLEIHRSLRYSTHFELVGASSVDDHGRFVYEQYVDGLPRHDDPAFADALARVVREHRIDAIYPAMDAVADSCKRLEAQLGVRVIGSSAEVTAICASKRATYQALAQCVACPEVYPTLAQVPDYPVFIKPDRGYGSRHTLRAEHETAAREFLSRFAPGEQLLLEYLPGAEYTIDCFSDRHGVLRFHGVRERARISNGISVRTRPTATFAELFATWAARINDTLRPRGAWFFQAKVHADGTPRLLEVAARLGGSSGLFRCRGVNFALLSAFDAFDVDVELAPNDYGIELDRALDARYALALDYEHVYVDFDDCLIVRNEVNVQLVAFLYHAINRGKGVTLLTRHAGDLPATLAKHRLAHLFDRVVHLQGHAEPKAAHVQHARAIFIDDSHGERQAVRRALGIPAFSPDMVEALC